MTPCILGSQNELICAKWDLGSNEEDYDLSLSMQSVQRFFSPFSLKMNNTGGVAGFDAQGQKHQFAHT